MRNRDIDGSKAAKVTHDNTGTLNNQLIRNQNSHLGNTLYSKGHHIPDKARYNYRQETYAAEPKSRNHREEVFASQPVCDAQTYKERHSATKTPAGCFNQKPGTAPTIADCRQDHVRGLIKTIQAPKLKDGITSYQRTYKQDGFSGHHAIRKPQDRAAVGKISSVHWNAHDY